MPRVKKTWLVDPKLVQRARKICGARTETETVARALQELVTRDEIDKAFRKYGPRLANLANTRDFLRIEKHSAICWTPPPFN